MDDLRQAAENDLKNAWSYYEEAKNREYPVSSLSTAAKYLEQARAKDPTVTVTFQYEGKPKTFNIDDVAVVLLMHEALWHARTRKNNDGTEHVSKSSHRDAITAFTKALSFRPSSANIYTHIAKSYLKLLEREKAEEALSHALRLDPTFFEAVKLRDTLKENSSLGRSKLQILRSFFK